MTCLHQNQDFAPLLRWNIDGEVPAARCTLVLRDARFPDAARALATSMLAAAANDKTIDAIFKDAGRYIAAMSAIYLHVTGGLTLPRLKALCAASGLLSSGRARDMLLFLRHHGCIELRSAARRGSPAQYAPTASFVTAWGCHLRAALAASRIVEPAVGLILDRLRDADTMLTFITQQSEGLHLWARGGNQSTAFVDVFLHRHAGNQIAALLLSSEMTGTFPSRKPVAFSVAATARRFAVSRIHVKRLLRDAQRRGVLRLGKGGAVLIAPGARAEIRTIYALQLIQLMIAAAKTLVACPSPSRAKRETAGTRGATVTSGAVRA